MFDLRIQSNNDFLLIEVPVKDSYVSYKYEIYGNLKFYSAGILELSGKRNPYITFNLESVDDNIFFVKVLAKNIDSSENDLYFSFYNHEESTTKKNLIMEITEDNILELVSKTTETNNQIYNNSTDEENDGEENDGEDNEERVSNASGSENDTESEN